MEKEVLTLPSKSYSLKRKAWEELNRIIVATVPYDNSMVDPDFNLNEHKRLFEAAIYLIDHADDFEDYQLRVAEDVLEKTCYGHRANLEAGELVCAYYQEAQEVIPAEISFSIEKPQRESYTLKIYLGGSPILEDTACTPSEIRTLVKVLVQSLDEYGDLPEDFLRDLEGEL